MSFIPPDMLRSFAVDAARAASAVATGYGFDIPKPVTEALTALVELDQIERSTLPVSRPDPKKLRASLARIASDARAQTDLLEAAREARPLLVAESIAAARAASVSWGDQLAAQWDEIWKQFVTVRPGAPLNIDSWTTSEQATAHVETLRAIDKLDRLLLDRVTLGKAAGEDPPAAGIVTFVAGLPPVPEAPQDVEPAWEALGGALGKWVAGGPMLTTGTRQALTGRERWESLLTVDGLDIAMAPITGGILGARITQHGRWQTAIGTLHSLGGAAAFRQLAR